jgi:hypothetical protein
MGQKTALVITVGLTLFVLGTGGMLALNLAPPTPEVLVDETAVMLTTDTALVDTLLERDALYQERLVEANQIIQQANTTNAELQTERDTLVDQNKALLEREALYRQAIEKANALLQKQAVESSVAVAAPPAPVQAPAPPQTSMPAQSDDDRDDHDERHEDTHDEEEEDDD